MKEFSKILYNIYLQLLEHREKLDSNDFEVSFGAYLDLVFVALVIIVTIEIIF